ncbi:MAG: hypothetical protein LAN71_17480 [Acidobacteriia bacterium]|nr:hypothetical protein [Terriglobia bacterium]
MSQTEIYVPILSVKDQELHDLIAEVEDQLRNEKPRKHRTVSFKKNVEPKTTLLFRGSDPNAHERLAALIKEIEQKKVEP